MKYQRYKIVSILILAIVTGILVRVTGFSSQISLISAWLTFASVYLLVSTYALITVKSYQIVKRAGIEDLGVWLQFGILLIACVTALITIILLRSDKSLIGHHNVVHELLFISTITCSWLVLHTSFLFRYAHLYYGEENEKYHLHKRGLQFPDEEQPDYFDFAYYSFNIGMTFQVSDVVIKSKGLRRLTLIHSLLSFLFNTILVAITINEIVNL